MFKFKPDMYKKDIYEINYEKLQDLGIKYLFFDLDNTIIIIKGVPARVCTQCGEQYFDDETAENIEKIVNQLKKLTMEVSIVNYKEKVA